jgi:hypothetical protein
MVKLTLLNGKTGLREEERWRFVLYVVVWDGPTTIGSFVPSEIVFFAANRHRPISGEAGECAAS